jgi:hypothetical protein
MEGTSLHYDISTLTGKLQQLSLTNNDLASFSRLLLQVQSFRFASSFLAAHHLKSRA